jgi:hypothetical protein
MNKFWPDLGENIISIIEEQMHPGIDSNSTVPAPPITNGELPKL